MFPNQHLTLILFLHVHLQACNYQCLGHDDLSNSKQPDEWVFLENFAAKVNFQFGLYAVNPVYIIHWVSKLFGGVILWKYMYILENQRNSFSKDYSLD